MWMQMSWKDVQMKAKLLTAMIRMSELPHLHISITAQHRQACVLSVYQFYVHTSLSAVMPGLQHLLSSTN